MSTSSSIRAPSQPDIPGDYQHRAMRRGPRLQRFWHRNKLTVMGEVLPIAAGDVVVDVGCGSGNLTVRASRSAGSAFGIDPSLNAVRFCRTRPDAHACDFLVAMGDRIPIAAASADVALLVEVIEHIARPDSVLREIRRVLAPGGRLLVTTPNYGSGSLWPVIEWVADRSRVVAPMAEEQHVKTYSPGALADELAAAGLTAESLGTFYRWSPLVALFSPRRASEMVLSEVRAGRHDGALIFCVARA